MLYKSQDEINSFYEFVIRKVAERKNVQDIDFKSAFELQTTIQQVDNNTFTKLSDFLLAYQNWYNVHVQINNAGTSGNLTPQQNQSLMAAIQNRDTTRQALIDSL
jgi:hypothetical protein